MRGFRGALRVPNFFVVTLCARNCISTIKLLAMSKTAKTELFLYFGNNKGNLGGVRDALGVPNYFVASLCTRNRIPAIKLLAI